MSLIYQADTMVQSRRPALYLGGKTDAKNRELLLTRHVTHILNMTPPKEASIQAGVPNYFESDFTYKRIAVYDASTSVTDLLAAADSIVAFIAKALHHGSCLVHCQRGVSRSTTAVLFYLMRRVGMPLDNALSLIQRRRPDAEPIPDFMDMLRRYETQCRKDGSIVEDRTPSTKKRAAVGPSPGPEPPKRAAIGPKLESIVAAAVGPQLPMGPSPRPKSMKPRDRGQEATAKGPVPSSPSSSLSDTSKKAETTKRNR